MSDKLKYQLFIGKVAEIIGQEKTVRLLIECDEAFNVPKQFLCGNEYRNKEKRCAKQCGNCQGNI